ncbi:MAG: DUF2975 domain-containing protein [Lachnospiraceae bacterium]|jgi:hypothetical protein|nr:DUF2975 domain-containing protein [Lachnospiraceae bacterium]
MKNTSIAGIMKLFIIGTGILGLLMYFAGLPLIGKALANAVPELAFSYYPWLFFLWVTGIPCYAVLVFAWRIACNIGKDRVFTKQNAQSFEWIFRLAAGDTIFFLIVNVIYLFLNMSHPSVIIGALLVSFVGAAFAFCTKTLSEFVDAAADLQEQSDLTI